MRSFIKIFILMLAITFCIPFLVIPFVKTSPDLAKLTIANNDVTSSEIPFIPPVTSVEDSIEYFDLSEGKVKKISRFDYVRGTIAAEMPPSFHPEALAAQGVSAHTRLLYMQNAEKLNPNPVLEGAIFSADPSNNLGFITEDSARELYGANFSVYWKIITTAAEYASTHIILHDEEPILAAYHAMSNSMTESSGNVWAQSLPYLIPVESKGDALAESFSETKDFSRLEFIDILTTHYPSITLERGDESNWIKILERSPSGYILTLEVGDTTLTGRELREVLGLRSTSFQLDYQNEIFAFTTKGYGHGVGLSQNGADFMARQGMSAEEILTHYYQGSQIITTE